MKIKANNKLNAATATTNDNDDDGTLVILRHKKMREHRSTHQYACYAINLYRQKCLQTNAIVVLREERREGNERRTRNCFNFPHMNVNPIQLVWLGRRWHICKHITTIKRIVSVAICAVFVCKSFLTCIDRVKCDRMHLKIP